MEMTKARGCRGGTAWRRPSARPSRGRLDVNQKIVRWYPALRIIEFAVSTACGLFLLIQLQVVPNHLLWVYIPTGIGGLVLNYLLFVSPLIPRSNAVLGLVGYGLFSLGVPLDLLGVLNMNEGARMLILLPGLLYELVILPTWLIANGFTSPTHPNNRHTVGVRDDQLSSTSITRAGSISPPSVWRSHSSSGPTYRPDVTAKMTTTQRAADQGCRVDIAVDVASDTDGAACPPWQGHRPHNQARPG